MSDGHDGLDEILAGRYQIERELGRGGAATVYLARDLRHPRGVAIKVLRPELASGIALDRFRAEIDIAAALTHPNILAVFDSGGEGELLYFVMPFVEGESLRQRIEREGPLAVDDALRITREVADALAYAHARGVVHRDIKPENILLSDGHAVVTDFGIARAIAEADARLTLAGMAIGTPIYMSPEQSIGLPDVDGRSDIYSLACVLYEMLTGQPPHIGGPAADVIARKLSIPAPPMTNVRPHLPPGLDDAVTKALAREPADRYATAREFSQALGRPSALVPEQTWLGRRKQWTGVAALGVLLLAGAGYATITSRARPVVIDDNRTVVAVFPFRATVAPAAQWSEAIADLLATALEGTPGVRVADPWSLWRGLRRGPHDLARTPAPNEAADLAGKAGACCIVLGSIAELEQHRLDIGVRIYRRGIDTAVFTFKTVGSSDSLAALVDRVSVQVIAGLARGGKVLTSARLESGLTKSPEALKAWLEARAQQRRGNVDSADVAIRRALTLDSTFVLALIDAATIESWAQFMRGVPYDGLREIAERAVRLSDSLPERPRLRARAMLASINTDGRRAVEALDQLVARDSLDFEAWSLLSYVHLSYGWQYWRDDRDIVSSAERAVRLDSTDVTVVVRRLYIAMSLNDSADIDHQLRRLRAADTSGSVARGMLRSVDALRASDAQFPTIAERTAAGDLPDWIATLRLLRLYRPERAQLLIDRTRSNPNALAFRVAAGAQVQLDAAQGKWRAIDSLRQAGAFTQITGFGGIVDQMMVAGAIAGVGDEELARRAASALANGFPPDSARAWLATRPVWQNGWLIAGYNAMYGDTALARRWSVALGGLPKGGHPNDYGGALQADIDARLAARRGDKTTALLRARRAFELWDVHTENQFELTPEPAMRFHLATQFVAANQTDSAAALFRSLVPPTTWMGFYTARASLELAEIEDARGDHVNAQRHVLMALRLWERGDSAVAPFRDRARRRSLGNSER